jgi:hypothetical protein
MVAVGVVQLPLHEIVRVIAVRDRLVSAPGAVLVLRRVAVVETRRATRGIRGVHADRMVLHAPARLVLEVAFGEVVDMALVPDGRVPARGAMDVLLSWRRHRCHSSGEMHTPVACASF